MSVSIVPLLVFLEFSLLFFSFFILIVLLLRLLLRFHGGVICSFIVSSRSFFISLFGELLVFRFMIIFFLFTSLFIDDYALRVTAISRDPDYQFFFEFF